MVYQSQYDRYFLLGTSALRKTGVLQSLPRCAMSRVRWLCSEYLVPIGPVCHDIPASTSMLPSCALPHEALSADFSDTRKILDVDCAGLLSRCRPLEPCPRESAWNEENTPDSKATGSWMVPAPFTCSQCAQTVTPLRYLAIYVTWLPRWEENVSVKAVNIIDQANNLEHVHPIFESDTSEVLLQQYRHWTRSWGRPRCFRGWFNSNEFGLDASASGWHSVAGCSWTSTCAGWKKVQVCEAIFWVHLFGWLSWHNHVSTRDKIGQRFARCLAVCDTGRGAGKQRWAQWRGPGIILGSCRGIYFVTIVIKGASEQLRHRTAQEQASDRLIVRDIQRASEILQLNTSVRRRLWTSTAPHLVDWTEEDDPIIERQLPAARSETASSGPSSFIPFPESECIAKQFRLANRILPNIVLLPPPRHLGEHARGFSEPWWSWGRTNPMCK